MIKLSNHLLIRHLMTHPTIAPQERWLAIAIAFHRNEKTLACFPTQRRLSQLTGIPKGSFTKILSGLRQNQTIVTIKRIGTKSIHQAPLQYYFLFDIKAAEELTKQTTFQGDKDDFECAKMKISSSSPTPHPLKLAAEHPAYSACAPTTTGRNH